MDDDLKALRDEIQGEGYLLGLEGDPEITGWKAARVPIEPNELIAWASRLTSIIERNEKPQLIACDVCGAHLMPGRLCDDCLYKYRPPAFIERNEKERAELGQMRKLAATWKPFMEAAWNLGVRFTNGMHVLNDEDLDAHKAFEREFLILQGSALTERAKEPTDG